jgi:Uma2 family endonuclease
MNSTARAQHLRPGRGSAGVDPTHYPEEKKMGEHSLQRWIVELLRPLIERWYAHLGKARFVGADQFIYYRQHDPGSVVSPDVYVLPGVKPGASVPSWKVWETGSVPSFALEVVSPTDPFKDYVEVQQRYRELGAGEVVVFDPHWEKGADRVRFQRWRRTERRGFALVESTNADRIRSRVLGCWLRVVGEGEEARLRIGSGPTGDELFPTAEEAALSAQAAERAEKEAERAEKEAERAEKEAALRRVAELEALLAAKSR